MPKVTLIQTNFSAGEISPKVMGRVDVARYQNGAESLENCIVDVQGAANRRDGTIYVAETEDSSRRAILIPFVFSTTQSYMLEFGHQYMRVFLTMGVPVLVGGVPFEIATPYTEDMLADLDYTQGADTMLLFHPQVQTQSLRRLASDNWAIQNAPFTVTPYDEIGARFASNITLSASSVGTGRTVTASSPTFASTDVARDITVDGAGLATITGFTDPTHVTVEIKEAFASTSYTGFTWILGGSPVGSLTPSAEKPIGIEISLKFDPGLTGWRTEDVGKFVEINGGLVQINQVVDGNEAKGIIKRELTAAVLAPAFSWSLQSSVWNEYDGYPRTGAFYEQRLVTAGTRRFPQGIWGSRSGIYFDFTQGTDDDEGFSFELPSTGQINPITRLTASTVLLPLTFGGEFTMHGGVEKPLTPTNAQTRGRSVYGIANVKPIRAGSEVLFVQRAQRKVRALSYDPDTYSYRAPDLTVLADHITTSGIVSMTFQQEAPADLDADLGPSSLVWCALGNGKMAVLTLDRDEGVVAWTPLSTDGAYECVASIPRPDGGDEVWAIVRRTINGVTKRYVELFGPGYLTDCAVKKDAVTPGGDTAWTGLDHLEGETVWCKADGVFMGEFVVSGGQITINRPAMQVEVGLPYENRVKLLRPEIQGGMGSGQSSVMSTSRVLPLVRDTIGCLIDTDNGFPPQEIHTRAFGPDVLDQPPQPFSGYLSVGTLGWQQSDSPLTLIQNKPYPFHLLAVVREISFNS